MNQIIKIFQIDSNKESIEISAITDYEIKDFGNGFFISNNGYLASVAHVLTDFGCNSFALYNGKLLKIKIVKRVFIKKDDNHIDAAIGKIDVYKTEYFNPSNFEIVKEGEELKLIGYSRLLDKKRNFKKNDTKFLNCSLIKLKTLCSKLSYGYYSAITLDNSFTIFLNQVDVGGLSGSPIINKQKNVVGVFKGGSVNGSILRGQVMHINVFTKLINTL